jgi:hypothetical protein
MIAFGKLHLRSWIIALVATLGIVTGGTWMAVKIKNDHLLGGEPFVLSECAQDRPGVPLRGL